MSANWFYISAILRQRDIGNMYGKSWELTGCILKELSKILKMIRKFLRVILTPLYKPEHVEFISGFIGSETRQCRVAGSGINHSGFPKTASNPICTWCRAQWAGPWPGRRSRPPGWDRGAGQRRRGPAQTPQHPPCCQSSVPGTRKKLFIILPWQKKW